ncbi:MAG: hypothetical protein R2817_12990 [Flavobacteriales bacterium]
MLTLRSSATKVGPLALGAVLLLSACLKKEEFPPEPTIAFKSLEQFGDSASLTITFTDGDGDIGLDDTDTEAPFEPGSDYYHNLFVGFDQLNNGVWQEVQLALPLNYRVPRITPSGQNKALSGELAVALKPWPIIPGSEGDTVRFDVRLLDRSLNASNEASSGAVVVE